MSKDGSVSGHTEGTVKTAELSPNEASESVHAALDGETFPVSTWEANLLSARGDSGSPVSHNGKVVGILKGGHGTETTTVTRSARLSTPSAPSVARRCRRGPRPRRRWRA